MDINLNETSETKKINEGIQSSKETNNNFEHNKETSSSGGGDVDSMQSDGAKTLESREERIKRLKEKSEIERQRKYTEIVESQRQSNELRQRQQEERRKKIEELKQREEDRKKKVEQRRLEMDVKEKEKNESLLRRTKERETRAAILQKQIRMTSSMTQSMMSSNQNRMATSIHSSGASSGSDKCTASYNRSLSATGGGSNTNNNNVVDSSAAGTNTSTRSGPKRAPVPTGFIEIEGGQLIPANTRHAGCFVPFRGPTHKVKGVLAWGAPPALDRRCDSSMSWWAGIGEHGDKLPHQQQHARATSAHASLHRSSGHTHVSTPQNLHKIHLLDDQIVDIDIVDKKTERSSSDATETLATPHSVKMIKTMSSSGNKHALVTPRVRSASRKRTEAAPPPTLTTTAVTNRVPRPTTRTDQSLFDRLSKPRSGSQQPKKITIKDIGDSPHKSMSTSFTKQPTRTTPRTPPAMPTTTTASKQPIAVSAISDKKTPAKRKSLPISAPDSGLTSSPVSEMEPVAKDVSDVSEITTTEEILAIKTKPKKANKSAPNKEVDTTPVVVSDNTGDIKPGQVNNEEETYRLKLTEQRRLAREAKERQQEEQRKLEEEAKQRALEEKKRVEEETRQVLEEETRRVKQLEEEEHAALEKQRIEEESERLKREEFERELEEKRIEKSRVDDSDRMERKRRLEKIMSRVKKVEDSNSLSTEESAVCVSEPTEPSIVGDQINDPVMEVALLETEHKDNTEISNEEVPSEPMVAWTVDTQHANESEIQFVNVGLIHGQEEHISSPSSPGLISDDVLNLPGPQDNLSCVSQATESGADQSQQPQFKSRLLQTMMAKGRLTTSSNDVRQNSTTTNTSNPSLADNTARKRNSLIFSQTNGDVDTDDFLSHSRSYNCDISKMSTSLIDCDQSRNGLSYENHNLSNGDGNNQHSDTENEVTLSSITGSGINIVCAPASIDTNNYHAAHDEIDSGNVCGGGGGGGEGDDHCQSRVTSQRVVTSELS